MVTLEIALALTVLTCGHCLAWRRRENVVAYIQVGTLVATLLIPLFGSPVLHQFSGSVIRQYANLLLIGAAAYLVGVAAGASIGRHTTRRLRFTFEPELTDEAAPTVALRTRLLAAFAILALLLAYKKLGYIPALAADRTSAKYGVGAYKAGFEAASVVYHFALALGGAALPLVVAIVYRRRKLVDVGLGAALTVLLLLSLSRGSIVAGPILFGTALLIAWGSRTRTVLALVIGIYIVGGAGSAILGTQAAGEHVSLPVKLGASAPDLRDHMYFLQGFDYRGEQTNGRTIIGGLSLHKGEWDPSTYALRTATGIQDLTELASGGLRLPPPLWGYASFGIPGAILFSALSGFFAAWGIALLGRIFEESGKKPSHLSLVLAVVFFNGTFGALSLFYFPTNASFVLAAVALSTGLLVRFRLLTPEPTAVG